jgi:hypothetical protein
MDDSMGQAESRQQGPAIVRNRQNARLNALKVTK